MLVYNIEYTPGFRGCFFLIHFYTKHEKIKPGKCKLRNSFLYI